MDSVGRKHPARQDLRETFNRPAIVFLTVCTKNKKRILANELVHKILRDSWTAANSWLVGRYVLMPDHLHLFCSPAMNNFCDPHQMGHLLEIPRRAELAKSGGFFGLAKELWDNQFRKEYYAVIWSSMLR